MHTAIMNSYKGPNLCGALCSIMLNNTKGIIVEHTNLARRITSALYLWYSMWYACPHLVQQVSMSVEVDLKYLVKHSPWYICHSSLQVHMRYGSRSPVCPHTQHLAILFIFFLLQLKS